MELRQLRYFVKAAETLNFSEAAKAMYVTQSTLSQQIRQLEAELGIALFERNSHSVMLTEAGEHLLYQASDAITAADICVTKINDLKQLQTGTLNIGVTYSFSPILTEPLIMFMKQYPNVKLNIYYKTVDELMEMLVRHQVDFVLAFKPMEVGEDIEFHTLFDSRLSVIMREGHRLSNRESLTFDDIKNCDFALPMRGMQARNKLSAIIGDDISKLNVKAELNEVNILLQLILTPPSIVPTTPSRFQGWTCTPGRSSRRATTCRAATRRRRRPRGSPTARSTARSAATSIGAPT